MIVVWVLIFAGAVGFPSSAQADHQQMEIGTIDFFGYGELKVQGVRKKLSVHEGEWVNWQSFESDQKPAIEREVQLVTGRPATDVAAVCCGSKARLLIYIGLSGTSSRRLHTSPSPNGNEHLDAQALKLYDDYGDALEAAVSQGNGREDWSHGYALAADPGRRAVQIRVRAYAIDTGEPNLRKSCATLRALSSGR